MTRSKKIFAAFAIAFILFLVFVVYDISTRTTFPGARRDKKEQQDPVRQRDSTSADTVAR